MAKVLDNGNVASQAPVHTAALVTHQHTPADGGPARVCGVEARSATARCRQDPLSTALGSTVLSIAHIHSLGPSELGNWDISRHRRLMRKLS